MKQKTIIKIEYYKYVEASTGYNYFITSSTDYLATTRKNLKRVCNDHYKKTDYKEDLTVYRLNEDKQTIIQIRHLSKKPLITI